MSRLTKQKVTATTLTGHVDVFRGGFVEGWVYDSANPDAAIHVDVSMDGVVVGSGVAENFREDLFGHGMGNGKHGFRIRVFKHLERGVQHRLGLLESETKRPILTNEFAVESSDAVSIEIHGVDGGALHGQVSGLAERGDVPLLVCVDGIEVQAGAHPAGNGAHSFAVRLPDTVMDGMPHVIDVAVADVIGAQAHWLDVLPCIGTPWQYLSASASSRDYAALPRVSGYRYASLMKQMRAMTSGDMSEAAVRNLMVAHQVVVEGHEERSQFPHFSLPVFSDQVRPKVSILVPVHNKFALTYHCLASIALAANHASYEVIVIDDCSSDKTVDLDSHISNVRVVRNEQNLGFLRTCNKGAAEARGEYVVLLNNDTEVTSGWLDEMLDAFVRFDGVGMVGSKLIYPDGKLQEAGGIVWGTGEPWNLGNGKNPQHPSFTYARQVDYLSGASVMISRAVWDQVGGLSDEFAPAYYEDTDLAFKVRAAGFKTVFSPFSIVVHFEGMSNGRDTAAGIKRYQVVNAPKFRQKWVDSYRGNGRVGEDLLRNMDRNVTHRVLMLDHAVPRPDHDAGSYAAIQEIRMLQANGCKVTFVAENLAHMGKYTDELQRMGVECIYAPFYMSLSEVLEERGKDIDLVYITRFDVAERNLETIRSLTKAKILFNNADLHFLRELRAALAANSKDLSGPISTRERELGLMRKVDAILSYNTTEHAVIVSHNLRSDNLFLCPWVVEPRESKKGYAERSDVAFLGGYRHLPNVEAVEFFVREVMPALRSRLPGVRFRIYGSSMPESFKQFACDDIVLEGFVEHVDAVYEGCRVFVAPLLSGAGIKGKVLEAMAYGVPCVLSPVAIEGTGLNHGINAIEATSVQGWVDGICALYEDQEAWERLSRAEQEVAKNQFSFRKAVDGMRAPLEYLGVFAPRHSSALLSV